MKGGLGPVRDAEVAGAGTHNQKGTKRKDGKIGIIKLHEKWSRSVCGWWNFISTCDLGIPSLNEYKAETPV